MSIYLYKTDTYDDFEEKRRKIIQEDNFYKHKPSNKISAQKHPATILFAFVEQFGNFLISLLNVDFSNFTSAYNTFFYLYGFELLKEYISYNELMRTYKSEKELVHIMEMVYEYSCSELMDIQYEFRESVDFIYNLNGNDELKEYKENNFIIKCVFR